MRSTIAVWSSLILLVCSLTGRSSGSQDPHEPVDAEGCSDSPVIGRFPGSFILGCLADPEKHLPVSLSQRGDETFVKRDLVGESQSWNYSIPEGRPTTEVFQYLERVVFNGGFTIRYAQTPNITGQRGNTWIALEVNSNYYNQNVITVEQSLPGDSVLGDDPAQSSTDESEVEDTIRGAFQVTSAELFTVLMNRGLDKFGDASAVALTKIFAGKELSRDDIDRTLLLLTMSFGAPRSIRWESDRQPNTTLFVLRSMEDQTADPGLKKRIANVRALVVNAVKLQPERF